MRLLIPERTYGLLQRYFPLGVSSSTIFVFGESIFCARAAVRKAKKAFRLSLVPSPFPPWEESKCTTFPATSSQAGLFEFEYPPKAGSVIPALVTAPVDASK